MIAKLATFIGIPQWAVIALGIALGIGALALEIHLYNSHVIAQHNVHIEQKAAPAKEKAADERLTDAATNAQNEKDLHNAIATAPTGGTLSPAAHALACERLRKRRGRGSIPASCGHPGSH